MYVYNTTTKIDNAVTKQWIEWQKEVHIPEVLATGLFYDYKFYKLLGQDETEGQTFIVQYFIMSLDEYDRFILHNAKALQNKEVEKWGDRFVSFSTLLQSIR